MDLVAAVERTNLGDGVLIGQELRECPASSAPAVARISARSDPIRHRDVVLREIKLGDALVGIKDPVEMGSAAPRHHGPALTGDFRTGGATLLIGPLFEHQGLLSALGIEDRPARA
jgi:hypothetical protein